MKTEKIYKVTNFLPKRVFTRALKYDKINMLVCFFEKLLRSLLSFDSRLCNFFLLLADCYTALKDHKEAYRWQRLVVDHEHSCDFTGESETIRAAEAKLRAIRKAAEESD